MVNEFYEASTLLSSAQNIIIFAGAGMSVEVGIQPYWIGDDKKYGSEKSAEGFTAYEHSHATLWDTDREAQIRHFNSNLMLLVGNDVLGADSPYKLLLDYLISYGKDYFVSTSNVDGAFVRAGFDSGKIFEVHGSRMRSQCLDYPHRHGVFTTDVISGNPTLCPSCQGDTRPNTFGFWDFDFNAKVSTEQRTHFQIFRETADKTHTVGLVIGAGTTVPTIHDQALMTNLMYEIPLIRINPNVSPQYLLAEQVFNFEPAASIIDIEETAFVGIKKLIAK